MGPDRDRECRSIPCGEVLRRPDSFLNCEKIKNMISAKYVCGPEEELE